MRDDRGVLRCEEIASHPDFRPLDVLPAVAVDLRYAGPDNFAGRDLYAGLDCAWLHRLAAEALAQAAAQLAIDAPGHRLIVLDALRPHRVQVALWRQLEGTALRRYLADPAIGSMHSFGMALDVTVLDPAGAELDMGSAFDEMHERSHPQHERAHLDAGLLSAAQVGRRELLRRCMGAGGFDGIPSEWWHFDLLARDHVRRHFARVE
jgi:D-alanyl-D-alanine dipeptidase